MFFLFSGAVLFGILKEGRTRNVNDRKGGIFTEGYEAYSKQQFNQQMNLLVVYVYYIGL